MDNHVHLTWTHLFAGILASVIVFGTLHLIATLGDNRLSRAYIALGF